MSTTMKKWITVNNVYNYIHTPKFNWNWVIHSEYDCNIGTKKKINNILQTIEISKSLSFKKVDIIQCDETINLAGINQKFIGSNFKYKMINNGFFFLILLFN